MKVVHTFWTKNAQYYHGLKNYSCGWLEPKYHYMSWILSCFKAIDTYGQIDLYTDSIGKELLVDILELPYSNVHTVFNDLEAPPSLWAYAKVITYSLQKEPYIHIDGDVFLWKKLPDEYLNAPIFFQNLETESDCDYSRIYDDPKEALQAITGTIPSSWSLGLKHAYNCGIVGVNDLKAMSYYTNEVIDFMNSNKEVFKELDEETKHSIWLFNCVIEQYTAYTSLHDKVQPLCLFDEIISDERSKELGYTHVLGIKHNPYYPGCELERLRIRVARDYPKQYKNLIEYLKPMKELLKEAEETATKEVVLTKKSTKAAVDTYSVFNGSDLKSLPKSVGNNIVTLDKEIPICDRCLSIEPTDDMFVFMLPLNSSEEPVHLMDQCHLRKLVLNIKCDEEIPKIAIGLISKKDEEAHSDFVTVMDFLTENDGIWKKYEIPLYKFVPIGEANKFDLKYTCQVIMQGKTKMLISKIKFILT